MEKIRLMTEKFASQIAEAARVSDDDDDDIFTKGANSSGMKVKIKKMKCVR